MSLFGSPPGSPSSRRLFDDGPVIIGGPSGPSTFHHPASAHSVIDGMMSQHQSSLFDDGTSDPWALPAPRARSAGPGFAGGGGAGSMKGKTEMVKGLLNDENAPIPGEYEEVWEKLSGIFHGALGIDAVRLIMDEAGLEQGTKRKVEDVIVVKGGDGRIEKGEFNVLMAMVGLAQEGDDINIDAVDDRRRNLPIPRLKTLLPAQPASHHSSPIAKAFDDILKTPATSAASSANHDTNINQVSPQAQQQPPPPEPTNPPPKQPPTQPLPTPKQSPEQTRLYQPAVEEHPWGSPTLTSSHLHKNPINNINSSNSNAPRPLSSSSRHNTFSAPQKDTRPQQPSYVQQAIEHDDLHAALSGVGAPGHQGGVNAWAGSVYSEPPGRVGAGRLGSAGSGFGNPISEPGYETIVSPIIARTGSYGGIGGNPLVPPKVPPGPITRHDETVTVAILPEKEGMFMFQHRNYQLTSRRRGSRVVRRYSDFVWLLDCLHKKYPFRCLPLLPPKRLAVNGHYLSADSTFLEHRRRGLVRFTNALVRHPVLSQDQLVLMFLTVPTELAVWRKQATISVQDEFAKKQLPPGLEESLPPDLNQTFETVRSGLRKSSEVYIQLCSLTERLEKRHEGIAADYRRFALALDALTSASEATYAVDTNDIPLLNDGLMSVSRHFGMAQNLLEDESKAWDEGALEDLKRQRDTLVSMRELFDRMERLGVNNIPQLEKRITQSEKKIEILKAKPENFRKPGELDKLETSIIKDKQSISQQHARSILVKECVRDELVYFQSSQYHVSKLHQDWAQERVKYSELQADCWRNLVQAVEGMPLGE